MPTLKQGPKHVSLDITHKVALELCDGIIICVKKRSCRGGHQRGNMFMAVIGISIGKVLAVKDSATHASTTNKPLGAV